MFNIRSTWIPVYFIDSSLCGLMSIISRSESENSFFSHFTNSCSTLMNFMNHFETAMEKQRHVQERLDHKAIDIVPKLKTYLSIECHASNVYTRSLFELETSKKKKKKSQFVDKGKDKDDTLHLFLKKDGLFKRRFSGVFMSDFCESWHIKNANVEMIPEQYILRHWTNTLKPATLRNKRNRYGEKNVIVENFTNEETLIVDHCVHLLSKDEPGLGAFVEKLKLLKKDVEADCPNPP
ncbi:protein FAR1-related sequence 5 [Tanacetum coccineum]|uniref:Protein FAR1-RELATED SEQUENCE n=1 Tax=Tanacetum coccineum TaxID=301880 RepID=A0ABQ5A0M1_9ASTR